MMVGCVNLVASATTSNEDCSVLITECSTPLRPYIDSLQSLDYIEKYGVICQSVNFFSARSVVRDHTLTLAFVLRRYFNRALSSTNEIAIPSVRP